MPQNIFCSILRFVQIQFLMSFRLYKLEEQVVKREKHKTIFLFEYIPFSINSSVNMLGANAVKDCVLSWF